MNKVSIVIPTRSRAHLLPAAIRSSLKQTYEDIEIVICDNASQDNTAEVVQPFLADRRIRYVRTPTSLSMPDNWDHALTFATGDYITYLTDDSVLFPKCIEFAMQELARTNQKAAVWRHAAYYYSDWYELSRRNVLYVPRTSNTVSKVDSETMLRRLFNMERGNISIDIPKFINSICHREVVESIRQQQGRVFPPSCPDFSSAAGVLHNTSSYLLIERALYIDSVTKESIGASTSYNMGDASKKFLKEFSGGMEEIASAGIPVSPAGVAKSIENVACFYPARAMKVNQRNLIIEISDRLSKVASNGTDVSGFWDLLEAYTNKDYSLQKILRRTRLVSGMKWRMVNLARRSYMMAFLEMVRGFDVYKGDKEGFKTVEEASLFANSLIFLDKR